MCVCVVIYIYICVCEVKIFLPFKRRDDVEQTKHKHVSVRFEKREKKIESKKRRGFFPRIPYNFTPFCFSLRYLYYYVELVSLCAAYTLKRGLEKREKTSAYKSNNNNNNKREKERTVLITHRIDEAEKSRAYTNDDDDDDGSSSRRL